MGPLSSLLSPLQLEDKPSSIVSIDTPSFASIAASAGKQEIKRGAGTTGRGGGMSRMFGGTVACSRSETVYCIHCGTLLWTVKVLPIVLGTLLLACKVHGIVIAGAGVP